jgi:hypothetical protein
MEKPNGEQNRRTGGGVTEFLEKKKLGGGEERQLLPDRLESTEGERGGNPCGNIEKKSSVSEDSLAEC